MISNSSYLLLLKNKNEHQVDKCTRSRTNLELLKLSVRQKTKSAYTSEPSEYNSSSTLSGRYVFNLELTMDLTFFSLSRFINYIIILSLEVVMELIDNYFDIFSLI